MIEHFRRVLVLCAHTDDEFGCAGSVARLLASNADVWYVALSRCEASVPEGLPSDVLEVECRECARRLGIPADRVLVERFPVRHFPRVRQDILERLVELRRALAPELVFLPSSFDTHQDHAVTSTEGLRAFKGATLLGYELPQNLISFENSAFVLLSEAHLARKIEALGAYVSQQFRPYSAEAFVRALALVRGVQAGGTFAEAFEVISLVSR